MRDKKSTRKNKDSSVEAKMKQKKEVKPIEVIEVGDKEDINIVEFNMELLLESLKNCPNLTLCPAYID